MRLFEAIRSRSEEDLSKRSGANCVFFWCKSKLSGANNELQRCPTLQDLVIHPNVTTALLEEHTPGTRDLLERWKQSLFLVCGDL